MNDDLEERVGTLEQRVDNVSSAVERIGAETRSTKAVLTSVQESLTEVRITTAGWGEHLGHLAQTVTLIYDLARSATSSYDAQAIRFHEHEIEAEKKFDLLTQLITETKSSDTRQLIAILTSLFIGVVGAAAGAWAMFGHSFVEWLRVVIL